jgi:hypothetical protein
MVDGFSASADWADLERELDAWGGDGQVATLWWRDDDAVRLTPALERLLAIAAGTPLSLAVIPGRLIEHEAAALASRLPQHDAAAAVLQHGWMHVNHAPPAAKKAELGADRPVAVIVAELIAGWERLVGFFGSNALPVLTPPWNRMTAALTPLLRNAGFRGLSAAGPRASREPSPGLVQVNTHADLVAWTGDRGFVGTRAALGRIVGHLRARRAGTMDAAEPTGILTHHLVQDEAAETFLARLLALTRRHPAARWVGAPEAFAEAFAGP